jgi:hypothetical protein
VADAEPPTESRIALKLIKKLKVFKAGRVARFKSPIRVTRRFVGWLTMLFDLVLLALTFWVGLGPILEPNKGSKTRLQWRAPHWPSISA